MAEIRVLDVAPKDIYVTFEMSLSGIEMVLDALDNAEITIKADDPGLEKAVDFLKNEFFKTLDKIADEIKVPGER